MRLLGTSLAFGVLGLLSAVLGCSDSVLFESEESKTLEGGPVFNRIRWVRGTDEDVWMMQQSHHGASAPAEKWDRLAIVIDKRVTPHTARYLQLEPGPLEWRPGILRRPYRVSCFLCHGNGPRAVRPASGLSWTERAQVAFWNLRIQTYGRIRPSPEHEAEDAALVAARKVPFRLRGTLENDRLELAACKRCHFEGRSGRGSLTRQQTLTIEHLVEQGQMPPWPYTVSARERAKLRSFMEGF